MYAELESCVDLRQVARVVNSGRIDSTCFYVNGRIVSVYNSYRDLSLEEQRKELVHFLGSEKFTLKY